MDNLDDLTTYELSTLFWGYYKDVHGVRPRGYDLDNANELRVQIRALDRYLEAKHATPEGREWLKMNGWMTDAARVL